MEVLDFWCFEHCVVIVLYVFCNLCMGMLFLMCCNCVFVAKTDCLDAWTWFYWLWSLTEGSCIVLGWNGPQGGACWFGAKMVWAIRWYMLMQCHSWVFVERLFLLLCVHVLWREKEQICGTALWSGEHIWSNLGISKSNTATPNNANLSPVPSNKWGYSVCVGFQRWNTTCPFHMRIYMWSFLLALHLLNLYK